VNRTFGIIIVVGIGLLLVAGGILVLLLYVIPNFSFFGANSIYLRNQFTTYYGPEIRQIFDADRGIHGRNIIIESERTPVHVRVRNIAYGDAYTITIFEHANGIVFNAVDRTHLNILQEIHPRNGHVYTRIQVVEPRGVLARTSRVYIHLPDGDPRPYNFIVRNGIAPVSFEHDPSVLELNINRLEIHGSGPVTTQASSAEDLSTFTLSIGELYINALNAHVNARSDIAGDVTIRGTSRNVTLSRVFGAIDVEGLTHTLNVTSVAGDLRFEAGVGGLSAGTVEGHLAVDTTSANVTVSNANSGLNINNGVGNVSVARVVGTSYVTMNTGNLTLGGGTNTNGVQGNVYVNHELAGDNDPVRARRTGNTNVFFAPGSTYSVVIYQIDGAVNVRNAGGVILIWVAARGVANVTVGLGDLGVAAMRQIRIHGSREQARTGGTVNLILHDREAPFSLRLANTFAMNNNLPGGVSLGNGTHAINGGGNLVDVLTHGLVNLS